MYRPLLIAGRRRSVIAENARKQSQAWSVCTPCARVIEGVAHLWLVEPTDRTLEAFELHDGQWLLIASAKDDEPVSFRPFDAITFSLGDLWP